MTQNELEEDLNKKCINRDKSYLIAYFICKLFKRDTKVYNRRSFYDLFLYYKRYKITEKMLALALYNCKFACYRCPDISNIVFFKHKRKYLFWAVESSIVDKYTLKINSSIYGKYTPDYLTNLFKSVIKE